MSLKEFWAILNFLANDQGPEQLDLNKTVEHLIDFDEPRLACRIEIAKKRLNISDGHETYLAQGFSRLIEKKDPLLSRKELQYILRMSRPSQSQNSDILERYHHRSMALLSRSSSGFVQEEFGQAAPVNNEYNTKPWLDITPLTRHWPKQILESPFWSKIESPIPKLPDQALDDTWVNLSLAEEVDSTSPTQVDNQAWRALDFDNAKSHISIQEFLLNLKGLNTISGLPGAGKTTLVKWIARHIITTPEFPFGIPIVISLRDYARQLVKSPRPSLLEHFLASIGVEPETFHRWRSLCSTLLDPIDSQPDLVETFLWILDGWDEVPLHLRDVLITEIATIARYPVILTSRHSGDTQRLPTRKRYLIQGLKLEASLELAEHWLRANNRNEYFIGIQEDIELKPDIRRMSRSPFLLTLFCALKSDTARKGPPPQNRGAVMRETLALIYDHHNQDPKQIESFGSTDKQNLSRFSHWLLTEADEAPRYIFDEQDYGRATNTTDRFSKLLVPSRLIARPSTERRDFQFLHANFQEYLAASHFSKNSNEIPQDQSLIRNPLWKEVSRFLIGIVENDSPQWKQIWAEARKAAQDLDPFGIIASRLAHWLKIADQRDGGRQLLGVDLRDSLWNSISTYSSQVPNPIIEAYAELDGHDFAKRIIEKRIQDGHNSATTSFLQHLSYIDIEFLDEYEGFDEILALPEVQVFCPQSPSDLSTSESDDGQKFLNEIESACKDRDAPRAVSTFHEMLDAGYFDQGELALSFFSKLDPSTAGSSLLEISTKPQIDALTQGAAVAELLQSGDSKSHQSLIEFLATRETDDPAVFAILSNLSGHLLNQAEIGLILDVLKFSEDSDTKCAAVDILASARYRGVADALIECSDDEKDEELTNSIFQALTQIAEDSVLDKIWDLRPRFESCPNPHWLEATFQTLDAWRNQAIAFPSQNRGRQIEREITEYAQSLVESVLAAPQSPQAVLLPNVLKHVDLLGQDRLTTLQRCIQKSGIKEETKLLALTKLAYFDKTSVLPFLEKIASDPVESSTELRRAACLAIGQIDPCELRRFNLPESKIEMARLAFRDEIIYLKHETLDSNGKSLESSQKMPTPSKPEMPFKADIAVFIALKEEFKVFHEMIQERCQCKSNHWDDPKNSLTFYGATIEDPKTKTQLSLAYFFTGEMGPTRAGIACATLLHRFDPKILVTIGIAGSLDEDLQLGDLQIPTEAVSYIENSAAVKDQNGSWKFDLSGKHYRADSYLLKEVQNFSIKHPNDSQAWENRCSQRLRDQIETDLISRAITKGVCRETQIALTADSHIATGPVVGKSDEFAEWIKSQNRKIHALEMETAATFDSAALKITQPRAIAIRGISDFADSRKKKVEKTYKGKFRKISMQNASDLFLTLMLRGVFNIPERKEES